MHNKQTTNNKKNESEQNYINSQSAQNTGSICFCSPGHTVSVQYFPSCCQCPDILFPFFFFFSKNLLLCVDIHSLNPSQTNMPTRTQAIVRSPFAYRYEKARASILLCFQLKKITFHKLPSVLLGVVLGFSMS